ncbi:MAG TPA: hypothetical protein VJN21_01460 [Candidatus Acidoferrales bacterium]|nr:hypothetical protein [Candidatus Acidoferrales bacterium]
MGFAAMSENKRAPSALVLILVIWCILLLVGWYFSGHWEWSDRWGTSWFEIGWIGRVVFTLSSLALLLMWRRRHHISLSTWLLYGVPLVVTEFLRFQAGVAVRNFSQSGNTRLLVDYSAYSTAYIAGVLLWIVLFPYDQISRRSSVAWRIGVVAVAVVVAGLTGYYNFALIGSGEPGSSILRGLQGQGEAATLTVFVILLLRTLGPVTASAIGSVRSERTPKE